MSASGCLTVGVCRPPAYYRSPRPSLAPDRSEATDGPVDKTVRKLIYKVRVRRGSGRRKC